MALSDTDRIRNLVGTYCERIDAGDFDGVGELFADACLADEHGTELARGATAVADFLRNTVRLHDGSPRTKHLVLNVVIDEPVHDGTVTARSSFVVLQAVEGLELRPIIAGRYVDRFAPREFGGLWHFVERRYIVELTGDLSRHMTWEIKADGHTGRSPTMVTRSITRRAGQ